MPPHTADEPMMFDSAFLIELAGSHSLLKEAQALAQAGAVQSCQWEAPILKGKIDFGQQLFYPQLNLRSRVLPQFQCQCMKGRAGRACQHSLALCIQLQSMRIPQPVQEQPALIALKHLKISAKNGLPLEFRVFLPPNLAQTAPRDAMVVKIDAYLNGNCLPLESLNRGRAFSLTPPYYRVAGLIETWCQGSYHGILQLNRERLRALLAALVNEQAVYWMNQEKPLEWKNDRLPGVHDCLDEAEKQPVCAVATVPTRLTANPTVLACEPMRVDGSPQYLAISLPSKDSAVYGPALALLKKEGFQLDPTSRQFWMRDPHRTLNFLAKYWPMLKDQWDAQFSKNFQQQMAKVHFAEVLTEVAETVGDFTLTLKLKAGAADETLLRQAIMRGQHYVQIKQSIYLLSPEKLESLNAAQAALSGDAACACTPVYAKRLSKQELVDVETLLESKGIALVPPESWAKRSAALKAIQHLQPAPVDAALDHQLRTYQRIGVAWLWHLYQHELGGILADEMGLGKTIQALALLSVIHQSNIEKAPCLVVCPAGLVENWRREAQKFTPHLSIFVHHREGRLQSLDGFLKYDLIITSYGTLTKDLELFQAIRFAAIVADEAQHVKNRQTRNAKALRVLQAQGRFLLTGTPLENSLEDLRALFDFLMPGYLTKMPSNIRADERAWYENRLRSQAAPYILRRSKKLVAPELPHKIEQIMYCSLEPAQKHLYDAIEKKTHDEIARLEYAGASEGQVRLAALNQLLRLRQVCADPRILEPKASAQDSAKLRALKEILSEAMDDNHRMLVFSQFVHALHLIRDDLDQQGIRYCYLDGQTQDRMAVCDQFNQDTTIPIFLISLKAGGTGLNLTGADIVVHYDPWWNPAVEAQATDRAHRIGQTRLVTSIKLIATGTVEEKVLSLQALKSNLLKDLLDASAEANARIGLADLKALLDV